MSSACKLIARRCFESAERSAGSLWLRRSRQVPCVNSIDPPVARAAGWSRLFMVLTWQEEDRYVSRDHDMMERRETSELQRAPELPIMLFFRRQKAGGLAAAHERQRYHRAVRTAEHPVLGIDLQQLVFGQVGFYFADEALVLNGNPNLAAAGLKDSRKGPGFLTHGLSLCNRPSLIALRSSLLSSSRAHANLREVRGLRDGSPQLRQARTASLPDWTTAEATTCCGPGFRPGSPARTRGCSRRRRSGRRCPSFPFLAAHN